VDRFLGEARDLEAVPAYFNGYRTVKLTTHVPLEPRLRVNGATPPLPYMPSQYDQAQLYLYKLAFDLFGRSRSVHLDIIKVFTPTDVYIYIYIF